MRTNDEKMLHSARQAWLRRRVCFVGWTVFYLTPSAISKTPEAPSLYDLATDNVQPSRVDNENRGVQTGSIVLAG